MYPGSVFVSFHVERERAEDACEQLIAHAEKAASRYVDVDGLACTERDDAPLDVAAAVAGGLAMDVPMISENSCR
jgi:hypothetical protein